MGQEKEQIIKYNVTYLTDKDEYEPLETVFTYIGMSEHYAKQYVMDAAEAYSVDRRYTAFEIQQIILN